MTIWQPQYCIGNDEIDRQHEHIFELANAIRAALGSGESDRTLDVLLDHLVRFMRLHFRAEERLMAAVSFPGIVRHKMEHELCTLELDQLLADTRSGELDRSLLPSFVQTWILAHLAAVDRTLLPYIAEAQEAADLWAETVRQEMPDKAAIH